MGTVVPGRSSVRRDGVHENGQTCSIRHDHVGLSHAMRGFLAATVLALYRAQQPSEGLGMCAWSAPLVRPLWEAGWLDGPCLAPGSTPGSWPYVCIDLTGPTN